MFKVHTHPDLKVLWKIKENGIDLNKAFCQGILDVNISYSDTQWNEKFAFVKECIKTDLQINSKTKYKGSNIGHWCGTQRQKYKKGVLSQYRIDKLNSLGFRWSILESDWNNNYQKLKIYYNEKGTFPNQNNKQKDQNHKLAIWITVQKKQYKKGTLSQDRIDRLKEITPNFFYTDNDYWNETCDAVERYMNIHNHNMPCTVGKTHRHDWKDPSNGKIYEIGSWTTVQRTSFNLGTLSQVRINKLNNIEGWSFESKEDIFWNNNFKKLSNFKMKHKRFPSGKERKDICLSVGWIDQQRKNKKIGKLNQDKINKLNSIGFIWNKLQNLYDIYYSLLLKYVDEYNRIPTAKEKYNPPGWNGPTGLGRHCFDIRLKKKKNKLTLDEINKYESINVWWWEYEYTSEKKKETDLIKWKKNYNKVLIFQKKNNRLPFKTNISKNKIEGEKILSAWCSSQRKLWRKKQIGKGIYLQEKIDLLFKIPGWWFEKTKLSVENKSNLKALKDNGGLSKNPKPKEDNLDRKITVEEANALENNNIDLSMNTQSNIIKKKKEERKIEDLTKEELIELVKKGESKNYESGIYCSDKRENDENKLQINSVYAKETSENKSGKIMILDGDKLITRKHLLDVGINEDDIFIAQFNEDDYNEQIKIHKNTYLMTLTDLLKEKKNLKFSSCWFDYLGQFNGSEKCRPKEDIDYYFKNDMALDNSIFALTFTTQHTSFNDSYESLNYVRDICKKYNYQADRIESKYYGSQMHFIMWRIFKN